MICLFTSPPHLVSLSTFSTKLLSHWLCDWFLLQSWAVPGSCQPQDLCTCHSFGLHTAARGLASSFCAPGSAYTPLYQSPLSGEFPPPSTVCSFICFIFFTALTSVWLICVLIVTALECDLHAHVSKNKNWCLHDYVAHLVWHSDWCIGGAQIFAR